MIDRNADINCRALQPPHQDGPGDSTGRPKPAADGRSGNSPVEIKAEARRFNFYYGAFHALKNINLVFRECTVTAIIGPSGCGKSTLLRSFNRMHDLYHGNRYEGELLLYPTRRVLRQKGLEDSQKKTRNMVGPDVDPLEMRIRNSMVFQKPNPFPKTIFNNIAFGLRLRGLKDQKLIEQKVEDSLQSAALWDEVKDRLHTSAYSLSGGQQQRLCIARALATDPEILLFDEPTSSLDPAATARIEDLIFALRERVTIIIVTHNMQQASRVSDYTAFMYLGELVEFNTTTEMFTKPANKLTVDYITGHFG